MESDVVAGVVCAVGFAIVAIALSWFADWHKTYTMQRNAAREIRARRKGMR